MPLRRPALTVPALLALAAAALLIAARELPEPAAADDLTLTAAPRAGYGPRAAGDRTGAAGLGVGATRNVAVGDGLRSAAVVRQNLDDAEEEYVRFCFGEAVQTLDARRAAAFAVVGPDPGLGRPAADVTLDRGRPDCVVAGFAPGTDLRSFTLGAVEGGVVRTRDDRQNIAGSVALAGARTAARSRTVGPDLVGVRASATLNRVEYHFDEQLDPHARVDAAAFGLVTARGETHAASGVVSVHGTVAVVQFPAEVPVGTGRRWSVAAAAVRDTGGSAGTVGVVGGRTLAPDLATVRRSSAATEYDYIFDESVPPAAAGETFSLYTDDGRVIAGRPAGADGRTVHVVFPRTIEDYNSQAVALAVADPGAGGIERTPFTLGVAALRPDATGSGRTTGPDLVGVAADPAQRLMALTFDERLDDGAGAGGAGIFIATTDHRLVPAGRIIQIAGHRAYVQAGKGLLKALAGVTLAPGAVHDPEGDGNPLVTVAHGSSS